MKWRRPASGPYGDFCRPTPAVPVQGRRRAATRAAGACLRPATATAGPCRRGGELPATHARAPVAPCGHASYAVAQAHSGTKAHCTGSQPQQAQTEQYANQSGHIQRPSQPSCARRRHPGTQEVTQGPLTTSSAVCVLRGWQRVVGGGALEQAAAPHIRRRWSRPSGHQLNASHHGPARWFHAAMAAHRQAQ